MQRIITPEEVRAVTPESFCKRVKFGEPQQCWEWQGAISNKGYGLFSIRINKQRKNNNSHRFLFIQLFGDIAEGICVLHKCDNRKCVNPNHLFPGTNQDNMDDMVKKGRSNSGDQAGEKNPRSKLNNSDVLLIKERIKNGYKQKDIAIEFKVTAPAISAISRKITWTHIQ